jgi:hypothetical protein
MKLTEEQFVEKYGDAKVKFSSYYKYTFTFVGQLEDGSTITLSVGGGGDDVYRLSVEANKEYRVMELGFSYAEVVQNETIIDDCSNYYW